MLGYVLVWARVGTTDVWHLTKKTYPDAAELACEESGERVWTSAFRWPTPYRDDDPTVEVCAKCKAQTEVKRGATTVPAS